MPRIQLKLMALLGGLVLAVVVLAGALAERSLRARAREAIERSLEQEARLFGLALEGASFSFDATADQAARARAVSRATGARVTLIAPDGRVLVDSDLNDAETRGVANHAGRPEVIAALHGRIGRSTRLSQTVHRELLYLAVAVRDRPAGSPVGVVRLAVDLAQVDEAVWALRRDLLVAGALGLAAALALSLLLSWLSLRPIRELAEVVEDIAAGRLDRRLRWRSRDERDEIAQAINRMARQMRAQAEDATAKKERLEAVLGAMVEGVLVLDEQGRILLANPRLRELLEVWGEVERRLVPELIRSATIDAALREARASNRAVVRELELEGGSARRLLMHASRFPGEGPRRGTVAVFHDVSDLRRMDRIRQDFVANASHELRTPLTAIRGFADSLRSAEIEQSELRAYLDVIVRNAERMSNLIDDLLVLSRIEAGRTPLQLGPVDVAALARTLLTDLQPRLDEAGLQARLDADDVPPARADRDALEQILSNLLSNAARYTDPGGRIDVRIERRGERVEIGVRDTGIGIAAKEIDRIFERFYRVDAARSRALGGTGLGLSITKHLVQAMEGEIRVESEFGRGSLFWFSLPIFDSPD